MSRKAAGLLVGAALLVSSCSVGPKYKTPAVPMVPAYKEAPPVSYKEGDGWKTAQPNDAAIRPKWWEMFGDPQLNALEEQINVNNQKLKVAEAQFRQARALIAFNRAAKYPTIGTSPSISRDLGSASRTLRAPAGIRGYGDFQLPFDVSYELDIWGRVRRSIEAARTEFQASAADLEAMRLSLHSELAVDYFELRSLDAQKRILDNAVAAYEKAFELTRNRFEGGASAGVEVAQAETQLESTRARDTDVGVQRAQFEHAIAVLTGQPPETLSIAPADGEMKLPVVPLGVPSLLLERRPDIAAAERRVASANEQIGIAKAAYYPSVVLGLSAGLEGSSLTNWLNWPSRFWAVGPTVLQTIFDGGRRKAVSQTAQASYDATVAAYRETTLTAFRDVEDNLAALRILEDEEKTQHRAVQAAQRSLQLANNRYKGGLVTYLEVVTAQAAALANERTEVDLMRRRVDASVLLVKALGGGWDKSQLPQS